MSFLSPARRAIVASKDLKTRASTGRRASTTLTAMAMKTQISTPLAMAGATHFMGGRLPSAACEPPDPDLPQDPGSAREPDAGRGRARHPVRDPARVLDLRRPGRRGARRYGLSHARGGVRVAFGELRPDRRRRARLNVPPDPQPRLLRRSRAVDDVAAAVELLDERR